MWGKRTCLGAGALTTAGIAVFSATAMAGPALGPPQARTAAASCAAPRHMLCVRFDGTAQGSQSSPHLFATSKQDHVNWHLEWIIPPDGNGTSPAPTAASTAGGSGSVGYQPPRPGCMTGLDLSTFSPPTLVQSHPFRHGRSRLLIEVPDPIEQSNGAGGGSPSIVVRDSSCPALIGGLPGSFAVLVNVRAQRHAHTFHVKGGGPFAAPGITGTSTMVGTITVIAH